MRYLFVPLQLLVGVFTIAVFSAVAIASSLPVDGSKVLHVKANELYLLGKTHQYLQLDELILENGAQLVLDETIEFVSITAAKAKIGTKVFIIAKGKSGAHGIDAASLADAQGCLPPANGAAGGDGAPGGRGKDVQLTLHLIEFGDLTIDTSGGAGGAGGEGGDGQTADQGDSCSLVAGGNAGRGGQAGDGGDGGHVQVTYSSSHTQLLMTAKQQTTVVTDGGLGEKGGKPGAAGEGSTGRFVNKKTLTGSKKWISGGGKGKSAKPGKDGRQGNRGRADVHVVNNSSAHTQATAPIVTASKNTIAPTQPDNADTESRLQQLEEQVTLLLKRIEQLEAK